MENEAARKPGPAGYAGALLGEFVVACGMLALRIVSDWILFPDGETFAVLRGRLYSFLFGWGHGVRVDRHVAFQEIRSIRIGRYTGVRRRAVLMGPLTIGDHCWIGDGTMLYPQTTVGDRVQIAPGCMIVTRWHAIGPSSMRTGALELRPIRIGSGAIINGMSLVLGGCHVGEGAVVMGGAKVTRAVPPNVIVGGDPARIVRRLTS